MDYKSLVCLFFFLNVCFTQILPFHCTSELLLVNCTTLLNCTVGILAWFGGQRQTISFVLLNPQS